MKMKFEHYEALKILFKAVAPIHNYGITKLTDVYMRGHADGSIKADDINKRLRWDLFHCISDTTRIWMLDDFYEYLNDVHIDTALKHIVEDLMDEAAKEPNFGYVPYTGGTGPTEEQEEAMKHFISL